MNQNKPMFLKMQKINPLEFPAKQQEMWQLKSNL